MQFQNTLAFAQQLDINDPLKQFRNQFIIPSEGGKEKTYFLGNSLGLQPKRTHEYIQRIMKDWATHGVESFFYAEEPWMDYHDKLTATLSTVVGCLPHEVSVMNNLSVNLHLMLVSFYRPQGKRYKILCEAKAFPSDQYMMETHVKHHNYNPADAIIEIKPRGGEHTIRNEDVLQLIVENKNELALVLLGGINYYSGQLFDMQTITQLAQQAGAKVGFDLAHAAGNVELQLHDWHVDFACWCSYKYLNSGPGAVAAVYIHERYHQDENINRFAGWWGYDKATRFKMDKGFKPIASAEGWQLGTPAMFMLASHRAALDVVNEAGWNNINQKRKLLTAYLWYVLDEVNRSQAAPIIEFITPRNENEHGCQVSMNMLQRGKEICNALMVDGFFVDWREPSVIRLAPVPLYNTFEEVWRFGDYLRSIL
ncbi:MAG: kynureninase [Chitinophagaceae bacterium]|nr:kynureninase [Chitinophagaceae bacterium]